MNLVPNVKCKFPNPKIVHQDRESVLEVRGPPITRIRMWHGDVVERAAMAIRCCNGAVGLVMASNGDVGSQTSEQWASKCAWV